MDIDTIALGYDIPEESEANFISDKVETYYKNVMVKIFSPLQDNYSTEGVVLAITKILEYTLSHKRMFSSLDGMVKVMAEIASYHPEHDFSKIIARTYNPISNSNNSLMTNEKNYGVEHYTLPEILSIAKAEGIQDINSPGTYLIITPGKKMKFLDLKRVYSDDIDNTTDCDSSSLVIDTGIIEFPLSMNNRVLNQGSKKDGRGMPLNDKYLVGDRYAIGNPHFLNDIGHS